MGSRDLLWWLMLLLALLVFGLFIFAVPIHVEAHDKACYNDYVTWCA